LEKPREKERRREGEKKNLRRTQLDSGDQIKVRVSLAFIILNCNSIQL